MWNRSVSQPRKTNKKKKKYIYIYWRNEGKQQHWTFCSFRLQQLSQFPSGIDHTIFVGHTCVRLCYRFAFTNVGNGLRFMLWNCTATIKQIDLCWFGYGFDRGWAVRVVWVKFAWFGTCWSGVGRVAFRMALMLVHRLVTQCFVACMFLAVLMKYDHCLFFFPLKLRWVPDNNSIVRFPTQHESMSNKNAMISSNFFLTIWFIGRQCHATRGLFAQIPKCEKCHAKRNTWPILCKWGRNINKNTSYRNILRDSITFVHGDDEHPMCGEFAFNQPYIHWPAVSQQCHFRNLHRNKRLIANDTSTPSATELSSDQIKQTHVKSHFIFQTMPSPIFTHFPVVFLDDHCLVKKNIASPTRNECPLPTHQLLISCIARAPQHNNIGETTKTQTHPARMQHIWQRHIERQSFPSSRFFSSSTSCRNKKATASISSVRMDPDNSRPCEPRAQRVHSATLTGLSECPNALHQKPNHRLATRTLKSLKHTTRLSFVTNRLPNGPLRVKHDHGFHFFSPQKLHWSPPTNCLISNQNMELPQQIQTVQSTHDGFTFIHLCDKWPPHGRWKTQCSPRFAEFVRNHHGKMRTQLQRKQLGVETHPV